MKITIETNNEEIKTYNLDNALITSSNGNSMFFGAASTEDIIKIAAFSLSNLVGVLNSIIENSNKNSNSVIHKFSLDSFVSRVCDYCDNLIEEDVEDQPEKYAVDIIGLLKQLKDNLEDNDEDEEY